MNGAGSSTGIIMGFNWEVYELKESWEGEHTLSIRFKQKKDNWEFIVTMVYGPNNKKVRSLF